MTLETLLAAIANSLWQSVALVAAAWIGLRYAPRTNAATRHLVWWAVLVAILLMPAVPRPTRVRRGPAVLVAPAIPASLPTATAVLSRQIEQPALPKPVRPGNWPARIFFVWLAVFLLQTARLAWSYRYLRGIKRRSLRAAPEMRRDFDVWMLACGVHRPAELLISREIVSPMAVGFIKPAVIVPEAVLDEFNKCDLDHVLLHELAHIARRDDWSNLAARLAWAFLGLHPAAAWALRQIEREREIACDDWVVTATGQARPYAASLARLFEVCFTRRRALLATGMAGHASQLGERIEMLLRRRRDFSAGVSLKRIAACAAVLLLFLAVAAQAPRWVAFAQDRTTPARTTPATRSPAPQPPRNGSFLAALVAAGYGDLPVDDIIALKQNGISAEFINGMNQSGWDKLPPGDLISLHNHGVSTEYLHAMHDAGMTGLTVKDIIQLREHGVNAAYIADIQAAGLGKYDVPQVIAFREHGVDPELLRTLKEEGFHDMDSGDVIALRDNGVEMRNLREARQYGSSLTIKQIIRLKQAGVI